MTSLVRVGSAFAGFNPATGAVEFYLGPPGGAYVRYSLNQEWRLELRGLKAAIYRGNNVDYEVELSLPIIADATIGSISDDGQHIAVKAAGTTYVIHVPTNSVVFSVTHGSSACEIHPSAPYIALNAGRTPYVYNYSTGVAETLPMPSDGYHLLEISHAQFSPNGDMLLYWGRAYWWYNSYKNPMLIQRYIVVPGGSWTRSSTSSTWSVVAAGQGYGDFSWSPRWNNLGVLRAIGYPHLYIKNVSSGYTVSSSPLQNTAASVTGMSYTHDGVYFIVTYSDGTAEVFEEVDVAGVAVLSPVYYGPWSAAAVTRGVCSGQIPAYLTGEIRGESGEHKANNTIHLLTNTSMLPVQVDSPYQIPHFAPAGDISILVEADTPSKNHHAATVHSSDHFVLQWSDEPEYTPHADNYALYSWVTRYLRPVRIDTPPVYEFVGGSSVPATVGSDPNDDNTHMDFLTGGVVWYYLQPPPGVPSADNAMQIQYRVAADDIVDLQVSLVQGQATRVIRDWVRVPTTPTVYSHQLTQIEKESITRWDNLYLKMEFRLGDPNN